MLRGSGRLRGGGNSFTPSRLFAAGEQGAWYDPSDFTTMFQDSAGTTPVTATGQPVGKILDKSGRGNHAVQATAANRPTLQQDGGGFYYLSFNGTNSCMVTASACDFSASDKVLMLMAASKTASTSGQFICELGPTCTSTSNPGTFGMDVNGLWANGDWVGVSGIGSTVVAADGADSGAATFTTGQARVVSAALDLAQATLATEVIIRINKVGQSFGATNGTGTAAGNFASSQILNIGARNNGSASLFLNGAIYGLVLRGTLSSATQTANAESWIGRKAGLVL